MHSFGRNYKSCGHIISNCQTGSALLIRWKTCTPMSVRTTSGKGPEVHKANYTGITSRPQDQKWSFSTPTHADTKPGMKVVAPPDLAGAF